MELIRCPQCARKTPPAARFCPRCGLAMLPGAVPPIPAAPPPAPLRYAGRPQLPRSDSPSKKHSLRFAPVVVACVMGGMAFFRAQHRSYSPVLAPPTVIRSYPAAPTIYNPPTFPDVRYTTPPPQSRGGTNTTPTMPETLFERRQITVPPAPPRIYPPTPNYPPQYFPPGWQNPANPQNRPQDNQRR